MAYLGPVETARLLATTIELRRQELSHVAVKRRAELSHSRLVEWPDLETPADLLEKVTRPVRLKVENPSELPHDLVFSQSLAGCSTTELLGLVLAQYGMTWEWRSDASSIRLIPFPSSAEVQKTHAVPASQRAAIASRVRSAWPDIDCEVSANGIRFSGLFEQHAEVEEWLRGSPRPAVVRSDDLAKKRLTVKVVRLPAKSVLKNLEVTGLEFNTDAGLDLDQKISLDLREAPIDELLEKIAEQLMSTVMREGRKVSFQLPGKD